MQPQIAPLAAILDLNTDLLLNCLDGLSEAEAKQCLAAGGNSVAFLAAHLTDSRHFLAARVGSSLANPMTRYLADARSIEEIREWPSLDEMRTAWRAISDHLQRVLADLTATDVSRPNSHRFPIADPTLVGVLAFLVQHDSYHVGQAAFLRRQLGKPAMSYTRQSASPATSGTA